MNRQATAEKDGLKTGDLILMASLHRQHLIQQSYTGCRWAHVGIVFRDPLPCGEAHMGLFESTRIATCPDLRTGAMYEGVQLTALDRRIASFDGEIAIRQLRPPLSAAASDLLAAFVNLSHGLPFNANKWTAARSILRKNKAPLGLRFFCSELVAAALQHAGVLQAPPGGRFASNYIPADFASCYQKADLPMVWPFSYEREVEIRSINLASQKGTP